MSHTDLRTTTKVLGFDLDQTLFPKSPEIDAAIQEYIYEKIAAFKGCTVQEAAILFSGYYKNGSGLSGTKTLLTLGIPHANDVIQEALENAAIEKFLKPDPAVHQLLQDLSERYNNMDLLTGSSDALARKKLAKLEIPTAFFNTIIAGDRSSKSSGDAYKLWLSLYPALAPEHFLYVGDRSSSDYEVPKAFGIRSVLVNIAEPKEDILCPQLPRLTDLRGLLL